MRFSGSPFSVSPFSLLSLPLLFLFACGDPVPTGAPAPAKPVSARKAEKVDPVDPDADYSYNPTGKRDPFKSFLTENARERTDVGPDTPPLQRWEIQKFALRGVIWGTDAPRALLVDPEGLGHVVNMGTYVGQNWGKVTSITDRGIVVTEEYITPDMEVVVSPITIEMSTGSTGK